MNGIVRSAVYMLALVLAFTGLGAPVAQALEAPLPAAVNSRGALIVGVKCDYPPFGFVDADGKNAGFEIDVARELGRLAFGSGDDVQLVCVAGPNRIPFLTSGRVDMIISVLSYTPDRAKVIKFSSPYFDSGVRMVVPKDSSINDWPDLKGKAITTTTGGTPSIWLKSCMPDVQQMLFDNTANSLAALKQGRASAFPQDVTLLMGLIAKDPSIKIVGKSVARGPFGIGVKLDNDEMLAWVNNAIQQLRKKDFFYQSLEKWLGPDTAHEFSSAVPRVDHELSYAGVENLNQCE